MINSNLTKIERIDEEIKKLNKLFTHLDIKTKKAVRSLIENAAFMAITLDDLQVEINENGVVDSYKNGENQYGTKKSPHIEIYNTLIKNHMAIMKQLTELLPKAGPSGTGDGFEKFVNKRDQ